jgi:hypothetical protein
MFVKVIPRVSAAFGAGNSPAMIFQKNAFLSIDGANLLGRGGA